MHPCGLTHADFPVKIYLTVRYEWKADCITERSLVFGGGGWDFLCFGLGKVDLILIKKVETSRSSQEGIVGKALYRRG